MPTELRFDDFDLREELARGETVAIGPYTEGGKWTNNCCTNSCATISC